MDSTSALPDRLAFLRLDSLQLCRRAFPRPGSVPPGSVQLAWGQSGSVQLGRYIDDAPTHDAFPGASGSPRPRGSSWLPPVEVHQLGAAFARPLRPPEGADVPITGQDARRIASCLPGRDGGTIFRGGPTSSSLWSAYAAVTPRAFHDFAHGEKDRGVPRRSLEEPPRCLVGEPRGSRRSPGGSPVGSPGWVWREPRGSRRSPAGEAGRPRLRRQGSPSHGSARRAPPKVRPVPPSSGVPGEAHRLFVAHGERNPEERRAP